MNLKDEDLVSAVALVVDTGDEDAVVQAAGGEPPAGDAEQGTPEPETD